MNVRLHFCGSLSYIANQGRALSDVFNTEAHPFKVAPAPKDGTYGTGTTPPSDTPFKTVTGKLPAISPLRNLPSLLGTVTNVVADTAGGLLSV